VHRDEVQFNDKTLWRGHVGSVVDNGSYGSYLDFGHLYITTTDASAATNYRRYLDIDEARAGVAFTMAGVDYEREYVASHPDDVVAIRYTASEAGKLNTQLLLYNPNGAKPAYSVAGGQGIATFSGTVPRTGTSQPESYFCMAMVVAQGGTIEATPEGISVSGADAMTVYLRGMTNFSPDNDDYISPANLLPERVGTTVREAAQKGYDALLADHVADYQRLYQRCQLTLTEAANNTNTPRLISLFRSNPANNLLLPELYFAYGRYLLISSSRGVALPANLQGIWNNSNSPAWNSDIHSNINVQMNYWPAEVTNLSNLHTAFTDYIHREACLRKQWTANARQIAGQTVGWTITTENNIYGSGSNWMQNYTIANAWYCMHLWQHYRYTLDTDYLWQVALPAMHSCCQYWMQRLVLASDGTYECPREYSPEHGPASENATAHSQQLVYDLFKSTLEGYAEYGRRTGKDYMNLELVEFLTELQDKFDRLDPGTATEVVNGRTLLREWKYTSQANVSSYNSHRHLSHLIGLYPGSQIGEDIDAGIYEAAKNSLNIRGYGGTGWSLAWKINLHARCHDGARCQRLLLNALALTNVTYNDGSERGGIYENLWDAHPPFQIDGNFGVTAGMAEMLVQSHLGAIEILPALPADTWRKGSVSGLRAVGAFGVDIEWANATATKVVITSDAGETAVVKYADIANQYAVSDDSGQPVATTILADNLISFPTEAGHSYTIAPKTDDAISLPGERPHADVIATRHYAPNGTAISASTPGLQIRQQHLSDGTTRTQKTVKK
jgi:alpha-L-fucosidase 2